MERRIDLHLHISYEPRVVRPWLALCLLLLSAGELGSENVTLTTYYPAPSGAYTKMITTNDTFLARDAGSVGIGTSSPLRKLHVAGDAMVTGETIGTIASGYGQFRAVAGSYGAFIRNDGSDTYMPLITAAADMYGPWNTLRPLRVNNASGDIYMANSQVTVTHSNGKVSTGGNISAGGNVSAGGSSPGSQPYHYVNASGATACTPMSTNGGSCAGYITWAPGLYVDDVSNYNNIGDGRGWWSTGPNLSFTAGVAGNPTQIDTTSPVYFCCTK